MYRFPPVPANEPNSVVTGVNKCHQSENGAGFFFTSLSVSYKSVFDMFNSELNSTSIGWCSMLGLDIMFVRPATPESRGLAAAFPSQSRHVPFFHLVPPCCILHSTHLKDILSELHTYFIRVIEDKY